MKRYVKQKLREGYFICRRPVCKQNHYCTLPARIIEVSDDCVILQTYKADTVRTAYGRIAFVGTEREGVLLWLAGQLAGNKNVSAEAALADALKDPMKPYTEWLNNSRHEPTVLPYIKQVLNLPTNRANSA